MFDFKVSSASRSAKLFRKVPHSVWVSQTELGSYFGLSALDVGKRLREVGLRGDRWQPTDKAFDLDLCASRTKPPFLVWRKAMVLWLLCSDGITLEALEEKVNDLALSWIYAQRQLFISAHYLEQRMWLDACENILIQIDYYGLHKAVRKYLSLHGYKGPLSLEHLPFFY